MDIYTGEQRRESKLLLFPIFLAIEKSREKTISDTFRFVLIISITGLVF
jgi:hypothetical protein